MTAGASNPSEQNFNGLVSLAVGFARRLRLTKISRRDTHVMFSCSDLAGVKGLAKPLKLCGMVEYNVPTNWSAVLIWAACCWPFCLRLALRGAHNHPRS